MLVEYAVLIPEIFQSDVMVFLKHVDVAVLCTSALMRHERKSVAGSCRHTDHIWELDVMVHHVVEYSTGENASHASSFKDEAHFFEINLHMSCLPSVFARLFANIYFSCANSYMFIGFICYICKGKVVKTT